jgi:hypothetical protein
MIITDFHELNDLVLARENDLDTQEMQELVQTLHLDYLDRRWYKQCCNTAQIMLLQTTMVLSKQCFSWNIV